MTLKASAIRTRPKPIQKRSGSFGAASRWARRCSSGRRRNFSNAMAEKKEIVWCDFNTMILPCYGLKTYHDEGGTFRYGNDSAITLPLNPNFKRRLIYCYAFALIPDYNDPVVYDPNIFGPLPANGVFTYVLIDVLLKRGGDTIATYPVNLYDNPAGDIAFAAAGRTPVVNRPTMLCQGGPLKDNSFIFAPRNPLTLAHTVNSPEPGQTILQPIEANFEANQLVVDLRDTTAAAGGLRIFVTSYAW